MTIRFNTTSNWTYAVQGAEGVSAAGWTNLFTVPARGFDDQAAYVDLVTNRQRFYRLMLSP